MSSVIKIIFSGIYLAWAVWFIPLIMTNASMLWIFVMAIALILFVVLWSAPHWWTYWLYAIVASVSLMMSMQVSASDSVIVSDWSSTWWNQFNQFSKNEIILDEPELLFGTSTIRQITENTIFVNEKMFKQITENSVLLNNWRVIAVNSLPTRSYRLMDSTWTWDCKSTPDDTLEAKLIQLMNCE